MLNNLNDYLIEKLNITVNNKTLEHIVLLITNKSLSNLR